MSKPLKVAIIGAGGIARTHVPGWQASPYTELVAAADPNPEALSEFGRRFGVEQLYPDASEIFADPSIDIVDICTPNRLHAPLVLAALEAGKHVLCEKPLAPTPEEIRSMIAARDRAGKLLMTAQHFRFKASSQAMKREIEAGALGDIYHARAWMLRRNGLIATPTFIRRELSGGGPGIDIGVHILDLTLWLMGNPRPISVSGVSRTALATHDGAWAVWQDAPIPKDFDVEDFAAAFVRFENGASLILEVSWLLHHDTENEDIQLWLYGTEGGCHWPKCEIYQTNYATRQLYNRSLRLTKDGMEPHAAECVAFAKAVYEGLPSPVPAEQSLQVITILDGIYRSPKEGREIMLDSLAPIVSFEVMRAAA